ncbi:unnamed protein product [Clonostachys byssicola]|uniref:Uncharacterized protein n=1 Tax=Clonostachys byssicola TaxID=160290 RepID=A0A9N9TZE3_9HYPO|nr:unnamed protein product [Clonostachys byssicola]
MAFMMKVESDRNQPSNPDAGPISWPFFSKPTWTQLDTQGMIVTLARRADVKTNMLSWETKNLANEKNYLIEAHNVHARDINTLIKACSSGKNERPLGLKHRHKLTTMAHQMLLPSSSYVLYAGGRST